MKTNSENLTEIIKTCIEEIAKSAKNHNFSDFSYWTNTLEKLSNVLITLQTYEEKNKE